MDSQFVNQVSAYLPFANFRRFFLSLFLKSLSALSCSSSREIESNFHAQFGEPVFPRHEILSPLPSKIKGLADNSISLFSHHPRSGLTSSLKWIRNQSETRARVLQRTTIFHMLHVLWSARCSCEI